MKGGTRKERSLASDQTSLPCSLVLEAWKAVPSRGLCRLAGAIQASADPKQGSGGTPGTGGDCGGGSHSC